MKTAIAIPDVVFQRVEVRVHELGMSRSEFFVRAAERYLDELDQTDVTAQIDEALARHPELAAEQVELAALSSAQVAALDGDW